MPRRTCLAVSAGVLFLQACSLSYRPPISVPPTSVLSEITPTAVGSVLSTSAMSQVPLHVGYGARGPWFLVLFTDPANPASVQATGGPDEYLVQAIDAARLSVHMAIYSLSLNNVRDALLRAHRRGVDVKLVTESDNFDSEDLKRLVSAGIPVLGDRSEGTMHDKFMVIDQTQVWTGSMNFTTSGAYQDNNVLLRLDSSELAADYEAEFDEMFVEDVFGAMPGRPTPYPKVEIDGTVVEAYFAPDDNPQAVLVDLLDTAQQSIYFLAYSFTSDALGKAVRRAGDAGVVVHGVMDEDQGLSNLGSELPEFESAWLDVRVDGNDGQMHEKVMIIDEEVVVVGSYNFSRNANETNDENLLVIHNRSLAQLFVSEFKRIYALSKPVP